jgi:hypothetical protein
MCYGRWERDFPLPLFKHKGEIMKQTKVTSDIYFASALIAMGATLENVDRTDLRHMEFTLSLEYPDTPLEQAKLLDWNSFDDLEKEWLNKIGVMGALYLMSEAIKRMKSVVHSK